MVRSATRSWRPTPAAAVTGATVNDTFRRAGGPINWTCTPAGGATCGGSGTGTGNISRTVDMPPGSSLTFATTSGSVSSTTVALSMANTATVTAPASTDDPNLANNTATDTDTIDGVHVGDLDRTSANTSATQWSATDGHGAQRQPRPGVGCDGDWRMARPQRWNVCHERVRECSLSRTGLSRTTNTSVTFVILLTHSPDGYQVTLNHDPDSGAQASNGTTISVPRP